MNILNQDNSYRTTAPPSPYTPFWNSLGRTTGGCYGVQIGPHTVYFSPFSNVSPNEQIQFGSAFHDVTRVFQSPTTGCFVAETATTIANPPSERYNFEIIPSNADSFMLGCGLGLGLPLADGIGWRFGGPDTAVKRWERGQVNLVQNVLSTYETRVYPADELVGFTFSDLAAGAYFWIHTDSGWKLLGFISNSAIIADYLTTRYSLGFDVTTVTADKDFIDIILSGTAPPVQSNSIYITAPAKNSTILSPDTAVSGSFAGQPRDIFIINRTTTISEPATISRQTFSGYTKLLFGTNTIIAFQDDTDFTLPSYIWRTEEKWPDPPGPRPPMTVDVNGEILWKGKLYRLNKHITV